MKISKALMLVIALTLTCSVAFAQRGRSGGAGGGASSAGMGSTMSAGHSASSNASGDRGMSADHMGGASSTSHIDGKQSPDDILSKNTKLSDNLSKLLPAGMTPQQACSGFKNLGQCVAAIHVAHNLDIPFADLKSKVTGGDNLGTAIQGLKPTANAKAETKKANKQANADLNQASS